MPSFVPGRRSRAGFEEDDDAASSNSNSPKRPRYDTSATSDEEGSGTLASPLNGHTSMNRHDGAPADFQPGAIVRVTLRDFVTYEHAEFKPGPSMNMVIGPNGTGKSSLVCGICLGLGYSHKLLGRAQHVGEYVQHGKDSASVEIELQKRPNERANHVVRLHINKEDNAKKWWLNGKESTHKAVQELTRNLQIQIDNLCQFLPQEKVAEFSALSPVALLPETLRATAPQKVVVWQDQLRVLHKDYKEVKARVESCDEILKGLENRQQGLQGDVDRLHEREAVQNHIEDLKASCIIAEYNGIRREYSEGKDTVRSAKTKLRELEEACGPALEAVNQKQEYRAQCEVAVNERKKVLRDAESAGEQLLAQVEQQDEKIKHVQDRIAAEENSLKTKRTGLARIKKDITDLEARRKTKPPEFVSKDWNVKIRRLEGVQQDHEAQKREIENQVQELKGPFDEKRRRVQLIQHKIQSLDSQQGQKLAKLRHVSEDAAKGWEWLQEHQDEFETEVFGPPMLTCSVKDKRHSDGIQALLGRDDFLCFITQTREDHKKLSDQLYRVMGLRVAIRTCGSPFSAFRPQIPTEQVRELGLDGYAIEFIEGPEPVKAMLCMEKRLHMSGVALREISNDQYNRIKDADKISQWAAGNNMYRVTKRKEYGPDAVSTTSKKINPGSFWTDRPVDDSEKTRLQREKTELEAEIDEVKREAKELREKALDISDGEPALREEIDDLRRQKNELQKAATQWAGLADKIDKERGSLEKTTTEIADSRMRILELGAKVDELTLEQARSVLQHRGLLSDIRNAHQLLLDAQICLLEAQSDVRGLEARNLDIKQRLDQGKAGLDKANADLQRCKQRAKEAQGKLNDALIQRGEDNLPRWNALAEGKTLEDLEADISAEESKLDYIHAVDPGVLRQFEKRAKDIQELSRKKDKQTEKLEALTRETDELMRKWVPLVEELVSKINEAFAYNFQQINCAGEVTLKKEDDFEAWAIEIKVKFRPNETLQQLDQHRQSGGERAVSTVFYLMALQSMAQAPFRVVDEINQGMDPRNERKAYERMVEIACREHTSQYFLITPKLLTGLRYDPRMRILCVASGEHMPAEGRRLDFGRLVGIQRALVAAA
ncbi:hypothetical protein GGR56DRAFT_665927 [Xylariaceae sp. FL0804]|nr:hypothetical protein GGR56DRAFT_665927 [Xylariaceae sp. FL0804]